MKANKKPHSSHAHDPLDCRQAKNKGLLPSHILCYTLGLLYAMSFKLADRNAGAQKLLGQSSIIAITATPRQGGGIEPLHVSMPHELKSCPSTSLTHPGRTLIALEIAGCPPPTAVIYSHVCTSFISLFCDFPCRPLQKLKTTLVKPAPISNSILHASTPT